MNIIVRMIHQFAHTFLVEKLASSRVFQRFAVTTDALVKVAKQEGKKKLNEAMNSSFKFTSSTTSNPNPNAKKIESNYNNTTTTNNNNTNKYNNNYSSNMYVNYYKQLSNNFVSKLLKNLKLK